MKSTWRAWFHRYLFWLHPPLESFTSHLHLLHRHIALHGKAALQEPILAGRNPDLDPKDHSKSAKHQKSSPTAHVARNHSASLANVAILTKTKPSTARVSFNSPSINLISFLIDITVGVRCRNLPLHGVRISANKYSMQYHACSLCRK